MPAEVTGDKPIRQKFKAYSIGYFHFDLAEVRTAEEKLYLFDAVDHSGISVIVRLVELAAAAHIEQVAAAVPYQIHTLLTDNNIQFTDSPLYRAGPTAELRGHWADRVCRRYGVERRLTKPNHPWTNGQIERVSRTIKEATVRRYRDDGHGNSDGTWARSSARTTSPGRSRRCAD